MKKIKFKIAYFLITNLNSSSVSTKYEDKGLDIDIGKINLFGMLAIKLMI